MAALMVVTVQAGAHDSWLSPSRNTPRPDLIQLEMTTGTRYPAQEFNPGVASLRAARCVDGQGRGVNLRPAGDEEHALQLVADVTPPPAVQWSCWVELMAYDIELPPAIVKVYLDEIRASEQVRTTWTDLQLRHVPWRESYRKFARAELRDTAKAASFLPASPVGMDMEIVMLSAQAARVGEEQVFQVLRDGRPLSGQAVELVSERLRYSTWGSSDAMGLVRFKLPFPGQWLVHGTDLRMSGDKPDTWVSRFATVTFEVAAARPRP